MTGRLIAMALLGVAGAACGASTEGAPSNAAGRGGESGAQQPGGGRADSKGGTPSSAGAGAPSGSSGTAAMGVAGSGGSATSVGGGVSGSAGAPSGAGGTTSPSSGAGGAGSAGKSGEASSAGGTGNAGGELGAAGDLGAGGADDDTSGLPEGENEFVLEVLLPGEVTNVTTCTEHPRQAAMFDFSDGERQGVIECYPEGGGVGDFLVSNLAFNFYASGLGRTDGKDVTATCDPAVDHCEGVTVYVSFMMGDNGGYYAWSPQVSDKSGWFQLDEFTAKGNVSGSLDLTMTTDLFTVTLRGSFRSHLVDCGLPDMTPNVYGCATQHN